MLSDRSPKITVITPTYNRADFLKETIESVLNQDYEDFEYLILDDGSTDNTREVVEQYLVDRRVKYFFHKNVGEAKTVNWGWKLSLGEYFTQVNSDDPILPGLFSEMVNVLDRKKNVVVAYPDFYFIDESGKIIKDEKNTDWNFVKALSSFSCHAASAGTFIRKSVFCDWNEIRNTEFRYINDIDMYWKMALVGSFYHVKKFLANWRVHDSAISFERYKSIPEVEKWFKDYFSLNLPRDIAKCKKETERSIYKYFISLIDLSDLFDKEPKKNIYRKKLGLPTYKFNNLQIGDNDLIGNKFNGHDLHNYLREKEIFSSHLVWNKESNDKNTYCIAGDKPERLLMRQFILDWQKKYCLNSVGNQLVYDILYNGLFLNTDIVHFHLIHNYIFDINILPIMTKIKPIVWTLHDPWALSGHCIHHFDCEKWKEHCGNCPYLKEHFILDKDNSALNFEIKKIAIQNSNFDVIVASEWMRDQVINSPIFKGKKVHLVPFGVNQDIFKPIKKDLARRKLGIPNDVFVISFRCDYSPFKGMEYIDYVLRNIRTEKKIFLLLLAGDFKSNKSNFRYKSFGWVKDDNLLSNIYNASDLFLMPSIVETFGMMAIEAMSCGVLPVVLDGTSLPKTVNAPDVGVSSKRNKDNYLHLVEYYINNDKERENRARKCLVYAREKYNKDIYIERIIKVYKEVMEKHKMDDHSTFLLNQIRKNMLIQPSLNFLSEFELKINRPKTFIMSNILNLFYKVDKIVPKKIRSKVKRIFIKKRFMGKHLS